MTYLDIVVRTAGTLLCVFLLTITVGAIYEVFLRRRPRLELNHNRRRRVFWLINELRNELQHEGEEVKK